MSKKNVFDLIFSVAFVGVILSFAIYFALTLVLRPEYNMNDGYFDGKEAERSGFSAFDDACLKNSFFHSCIIEAEYKLFGNIFGGDVIRGKNGFLFMSGVSDSGYDYVADYTGDIVMDDDALEVVYRYIDMRSKVYENRNIKYYLAVIPNSQTVYSEYMPSVYGEISDERVLFQVGAYLEQKGFDGFIDLTETMINAKSEGLLYNNTENSINALGAYYVYEGIMSRLIDDRAVDDRTMKKELYELYTHFTSGKTAAELAGIADILQNETVSMSNATEYMYTTVEIFEDIETTYTKSEYKDDIPLKPSILLEVTGEWDKIQLKPYFSNTFGMASYRASHLYSTSALDNSNPSIVVQVIHEDELMTVIDPAVTASYDSGFAIGQDPYKTSKPREVEYSVISSNTVCITGEIESGAEVSVFGDDIVAYSVSEIGGRFITSISFSDSAVGKEIFLRAKAEGKTVSDPVNLLTTEEYISQNSSDGVCVGSNSMVYLSDYKVPAIPQSSRLELISADLSADMLRYRATAGEDVSVIYAMIPEKLSVYRAGAPETLADQISDLETIRSLLRVELRKAGMTVVDLADVVRLHMDEGKMFAQTSEAITDLASYYMYRELIDRIAEDFGAVVPKDKESFSSIVYKTGSGTHALALGFENYRLIEKTDSLVVRSSAEYFQGGSTDVDKTKEYTVRNYIDELPRAIIVRDGVGTKLLDMLADHFETMYVMAEGETEIPDSVLRAVDPDYIIYLCDEESICNMIR